MKIIAYLSLISFFLIVGFSACDQQKVDTKPKELPDGSVRIVTYDSCEYIVVGGGHSRWGTHKGNCINPIHSK